MIMSHIHPYSNSKIDVEVYESRLGRYVVVSPCLPHGGLMISTFNSNFWLLPKLNETNVLADPKFGWSHNSNVGFILKLSYVSCPIKKEFLTSISSLDVTITCWLRFSRHCTSVVYHCLLMTGCPYHWENPHHEICFQMAFSGLQPNRFCKLRKNQLHCNDRI